MLSYCPRNTATTAAVKCPWPRQCGPVCITFSEAYFEFSVFVRGSPRGRVNFALHPVPSLWRSKMYLLFCNLILALSTMPGWNILQLCLECDSPRWKWGLPFHSAASPSFSPVTPSRNWSECFTGKFKVVSCSRPETVSFYLQSVSWSVHSYYRWACNGKRWHWGPHNCCSC